MKHLRRVGAISALTALLLSSPLFGEEKKSEASQESYTKAVKLYNSNNYLEAYKIFNNLFSTQSDDPRINFYLGRCATELKQYDEALLAFERVLILDPRHVRSRMEMGRVYFEEKQYDSAAAEFEKALEYPMPDSVKVQAKKFLEVIAAAKKKHFFSGAFIAGLSYDTNINNDIGDKTYTAGIFQGLSGNTQKADYSMSETLALNHSYRFNGSDFSWQNSAVLYHQHYRQAIASDVLFAQIGSGVAYKTKAYEVSLTPALESLKYGRTHVPDRASGIGAVADTFSRLTMIDRLQDTMWAMGVTEKFLMPIGDDMLFDQSLGLKSQFFKYSNDGMNAKIIDASAGLKKIFAGGRILGASMGLTKNIQSNKTGRTDVAQSSKSAKIDFSTPVGSYFDLSLNASYKHLTYADVDPIFGKRRVDMSKSYGFGVMKQVGEGFIVSGSFNRLLNSSNFDTGVYQKNTYGISLIKSF